MGGVEAWDADKHTVRKLALKLRSLDLPNVDVETVEIDERNSRYS